MSERYTRKDAEAAFGRLCTMLGKRPATAWNDVGGWSLDYNGVYGGFVVDEVSNESGGVSRPLGDQRRPAREFCDVVYFLTRAREVDPAPRLVAEFYREARSWHDSTGHGEPGAGIRCDGICEVMHRAERELPAVVES